MWRICKKLFGLLGVLVASSYPTVANEKTPVIVFHAGSLSVPFQKLEEEFEKLHPEIDIRRESSGSVMAIKKVVELKKPCDCVASADYTIIPKMMFPKYAKEVKVFASNELVLCYTSKSKYANEINSQNWFKILKKEDVKWGFSNPNLDPCGYRTLMALVLASKFYKNSQILKLLEESVPIKVKIEGESFLIKVPKNLKPKKRQVFIRPKAVALLGLLESGAIDYAFEYKSVALQHRLKFVELPPAVNLSSLEHKETYKRVKVLLGNGKTVEGSPIAYGIAVVQGAPHKKEAEAWVNFVTSPIGTKIMKESFQEPIYPPKIIRYEQ